jgi:hypothetical protein
MGLARGLCKWYCSEVLGCVRVMSTSDSIFQSVQSIGVLCSDFDFLDETSTGETVVCLGVELDGYKSQLMSARVGDLQKGYGLLANPVFQKAKANTAVWRVKSLPATTHSHPFPLKHKTDEDEDIPFHKREVPEW